MSLIDFICETKRHANIDLLSEISVKRRRRTSVRSNIQIKRTKQEKNKKSKTTKTDIFQRTTTTLELREEKSII